MGGALYLPLCGKVEVRESESFNLEQMQNLYQASGIFLVNFGVHSKEDERWEKPSYDHHIVLVFLLGVLIIFPVKKTKNHVARELYLLWCGNFAP
jgi:hypothetical protein